MPAATPLIFFFFFACCRCHAAIVAAVCRAAAEAGHAMLDSGSYFAATPPRLMSPCCFVFRDTYAAFQLTLR